MEIDKENIKHLTMLDMSGQIGPEERDYLWDIVVENKEAAEIYHGIFTKFSPEKMARISKELHASFEIRLAAAKRKEKFKKSAKVVGMAVSAVAAAILLVVFLLPGTQERVETPVNISQNSPAKDIELKIGSAPAINLSKQQGTIQAGNVMLNNKNSQLSLLNAAGETRIATLTVPNGREYMLQLPDGSSVQLNAATTLRFPLAFKGNTREITISGEAYVIVKKDAAHPFYVHLPHGTVQVLGTEFNINTYQAQEDRIALVNGSIKVKNTRDSSSIKPGYEATVTSRALLQVDEFDQYDVLSWRKGVYPFTNASLEVVATLIERYYGIPVKFEGQPASEKFTGVISRKTPITNFLTGLKLTGFVKEFTFDKDGTLHLK